MKSKSVLVGGYQSIVDNGRNHSIVLDLPKHQEGSDIGATALELSVMSFAGCISTIFKVVAEKMRINVEKLEIESEAEKGKETIEKVTFNVKVKSDAPQDKLEKCLETTCNTCPVGVLFKNAGVKIERNLIKL